jgi:hypothetical protein
MRLCLPRHERESCDAGVVWHASHGAEKIDDMTKAIDERVAASSCNKITESHSRRSVAKRIDDRLSALEPDLASLSSELRRLVEEIVDEAAETLRNRWCNRWQEARDLIECVLSHLVSSPHEIPPKHRLATLRSVLLRPEGVIRDELVRIEAESASALARRLALGLLAIDPDIALAEIRVTAVKQTYWLSVCDRHDYSSAALIG